MDVQGLWRPAGETEATSNMAAFVEWLRATGRRPATSPGDVRCWWGAEPDALLAAIAEFAAADPEDGPLLAALAEQLLLHETRPADTLSWRGDRADPRARAARLIRATLVGVRPEEQGPGGPAASPPSSR